MGKLILAYLLAISHAGILFAKEVCFTRADGARLVCNDGFRCERKGNSFECVSIKITSLSKDETQDKPFLSGKVTLLNTAFKAQPVARNITGRVVASVPANSPTLQRIAREQARDRLINKVASTIVKTGASQKAQYEAERLVRKMLRNVSDDVLKNIADAGYSIYIIPRGKKLTDLPEFSGLKGKKTFDGRDWESVSGVLSSNAKGMAVAEEDLLNGKSSYEKNSIFAHEFAHLIAASDKTVNLKISAAYEQNIKDREKFSDDYASTNKDEYFARSSEMWFGVYSESKWNPFSDPKDKDWLKANDPEMYQLLNQLYG